MGYASPDGSVHVRFRDPPVAALAEGPVWVVDEVSGRRYAVGNSARIEADRVLVDDAATFALADVLGYETVLVPSSPCPGIWAAYAPGTQVAIVWIRTGDED